MIFRFGFAFLFIIFFGPRTVVADTLPQQPENSLSTKQIESFIENNLPQAPKRELTQKLITKFKLNNRLISLWAEKMRSDGNVIIAQGAVRLTLGRSELIAQEIHLDPDTKTAVAVGRAILRDGTSVVVCDGVEMDLEQTKVSTGPLILALYGKDRQAVLAQQRAEKHTKLPNSGRMLMISGDNLQGRFELADEPSELVVENAWASPCACSAKSEPAWAVRVRRLELTQNEDMKLTMPVFEIFGVPLGWLPIAWIPIGTRRSGILAPVFQLRDGFWAVQPLYLTLGPSVDTTLAPGYVLARGPRFEGELRWRPRWHQFGQMNLIWQYDGFAAEEHLNQSDPIHRVAGRFEHTGRWKGGTRFHIDGRGMTDKKVPIELGAAFGERVLAYTRSGMQMSWANPNWGGSLSSALFQDLRQSEFSFVSGHTDIRAQELLRGRLGGLPTKLGGPFWANFDMGTDLVLPMGDEKDRDLTRGIGERLFAQGNLSALWGGRFASVYTKARLRGAHQYDLLSQQAGTLAYGMLNSGLRTRVVGDGKIADIPFSHDVVPQLEWAQIPWRFDDNYEAFDSDDRMEEGSEIALSLNQTIAHKKDRLKYLKLTTAVSHELYESFNPTWYTDLKIKNHNWLVEWEGMGRIDSEKIDGFRFRFKMPLGKPAYLQLGWWRLGEDRPRMFYQHLEEPLAGWSITPVGDTSVRDRLDARLTITRLKNFRLSYETAFSSPTFSLENWDAPFYLLTHGGKIKWTAPCDCMALETSIRFWPYRDTPEIRFSLALSALGETVELF